MNPDNQQQYDQNAQPPGPGAQFQPQPNDGSLPQPEDPYQQQSPQDFANQNYVDAANTVAQAYDQQPDPGFNQNPLMGTPAPDPNGPLQPLPTDLQAPIDAQPISGVPLQPPQGPPPTYVEPQPQPYEPAPVPVQQPQAPIDSYGASSSTYTASSSKPTRNKGPLILGGIAILFFVFLIIAIFLVLGGSSDPGDTTTPDDGTSQTPTAPDDGGLVNEVTDEDRQLLKNAFINSLRKSSQTITASTDEQLGVTDFNFNVDLSDVTNPTLAGDITIKSAATEGDSKFDVVIPGDGLVYVKINEFDEPDLTVPSVKLNAWLTYPQDFDTISAAEYDFLAEDQTAQVVGYITRTAMAYLQIGDVVPEAGFLQEQQDELSILYEVDVPYEITSTRSETVDGSRFRILEFTTSEAKMKPILDRVASFTGEDSSLTSDDFNRTFSVEINETTNVITKFTSTLEDSTRTETYSNFDQPFQIAAPLDAVSSLSAN